MASVLALRAQFKANSRAF